MAIEKSLMLASLIKRIKSYKTINSIIFDELNNYRKSLKIIPPHSSRLEIKRYGLKDYQIYPEGKNLSVDFLTSTIDSKWKFITKDTPISSMGSCFAAEIRLHLLARDYNFIQKEEHRWFSCAWGRVFSSINMSQILSYSYDSFEPDQVYWFTKKGVMDPFRDSTVPSYKSARDAEEGIKRHRLLSKEALNESNVFIFTLGQNEVWIDEKDGKASTVRPPEEVLKKKKFYLKRLTIADNIKYMKEGFQLLWKNNPDCKVILTLSPVPSYATFYDTNVVLRSIANKALLLNAAHDLAEEYSEKVCYFPAFEIVNYISPLPYRTDKRHIKYRTVMTIMDCFEKVFCMP
jgi:hypothetical protein